MALYDTAKAASAFREGLYFTDGKRLLRVLQVHDGHLLLENCRCPDENPAWLSIPAVVAGLTLVRPA